MINGFAKPTFYIAVKKDGAIWGFRELGTDVVLRWESCEIGPPHDGSYFMPVSFRALGETVTRHGYLSGATEDWPGPDVRLGPVAKHPASFEYRGFRIEPFFDGAGSRNEGWGARFVQVGMTAGEMLGGRPFVSGETDLSCLVSAEAAIEMAQAQIDRLLDIPA